MQRFFTPEPPSPREPSSGSGPGRGMPEPRDEVRPSGNHLRFRALRAIAPYVWPQDRPDLQRRVIYSLLLMLAAKLVTVAMPFF
ncbi:MAG: hypothetical protein AB7L90_06805 [Hyphomicrobiaceae bacterium]